MDRKGIHLEYLKPSLRKNSSKDVFFQEYRIKNNARYK